jgi:hypothetical protein
MTNARPRGLGIWYNVKMWEDLPAQADIRRRVVNCPARESECVAISLKQIYCGGVVRQEILRWKKSTKTFELKMRQSSLGKNQSCSIRSCVQIILYRTKTIL